MVSDDQKKIVLADWKAASSDLEALGEAVFVEMFTRHPDWIPMFSNLSGSSVDSIKGTPALKAHGKIVMGRLDEYMNLLEKGDMAKLNSLLSQQASTHKPRGIKADQFKEMNCIIPTVLKARLPSFDAKQEAAWAAVLAVVIDGIAAQL